MWWYPVWGKCCEHLFFEAWRQRQRPSSEDATFLSLPVSLSLSKYQSLLGRQNHESWYSSDIKMYWLTQFSQNSPSGLSPSCKKRIIASSLTSGAAFQLKGLSINLTSFVYMLNFVIKSGVVTFVLFIGGKFLNLYKFAGTQRSPHLAAPSW